jgi:hypothetical protein
MNSAKDGTAIRERSLVGMATRLTAESKGGTLFTNRFRTLEKLKSTTKPILVMQANDRSNDQPADAT